MFFAFMQRSFPARYLLFSILTTLAHSCGSAEDWNRQTSPSTLIKHPSTAELRRRQARPLEYLVAWKEKSSPAFRRHGFTAAYRQSLEEHYRARYVDRQVFENIELLSELSWVSSFDPQSIWSTPLSWLPRSLTEPTADYSQMRISLVHFPSQETAHHTLQELAHSGKIWYAEPHYQSQLQQNTSLPLPPWLPPPPAPSLPPKNLGFAELKNHYTEKKGSLVPYHVKALSLPEAFDIFAQLPQQEQQRALKRAPIIAIMDSGVDIQHPAIAHKIIDLSDDKLRGARACSGDLHGCNTTQNYSESHLGDGDVFPVATNGFGQTCPYPSPQVSQKKHNYCRHGTHVTGLAVGFAPKRVFGACPFCRFLPVRIVAENLNIPDSSIIRGLQYISLFQGAEGERVRVVNASFGKPHESLTVSLLIRRLAQKENILVVAAAGNSSSVAREYPGSLQDVLAVTAVTREHKNIRQANIGTWIGVAAPGAQLLSSVPGGSTDYDSGTSMAAPLVSGVAGLVLARTTQGLAAAQLRQILEESAQTETLYRANPLHRAEGEKSHKKGTLGSGLVNAAAALQSPLLQNPQNTPKMRIGGCASLRATSSLYAVQETSQSAALLQLMLLLLPLWFVFLRIAP